MSQKEKLMRENENLSAHLTKCQEDSGKLEAKLRALQINSNTELSAHDQQIQNLDNQIKSLKAEKNKCVEQLSKVEDQCRQLHDKVEKLSDRNRSLTLECEGQRRQVRIDSSLIWTCRQ